MPMRRKQRCRSPLQSGKTIWLFLLALVLADGPHRCSVQGWASPLLMLSTPAKPRRKGSPQSSFTGKKSGSNSPSNGRRKRRNPSKKTNTSKQKQPKKTSSSSPNGKPKSIGEAVQQAQTIPEFLEVASQFWLPTDSDLPSHLRTQALHHEKRQRWSSQWLSKLGAAGLHASTAKVWEDPRFARAVLAAALPFASDKEEPLTDKDLRILREALLGLHTLVGPMERCHTTSLNEDVLHGVQLLVERAETNADRYLLPEVMEVRWATRGLLAKLGSAVATHNECNEEEDKTNLQQYLASALPRLEDRVKGLPFDILPMGVDFEDLHWLEDRDSDMASQKDIMTSLQESIPFQFDTIVTRQGTSVMERRGTAWVAEDGIGALAYSGKLMPPSAVPPLVRNLMGQVEDAIDAPTKGFFDCALCNFYPNGESACKFHTDPEHGTMWDRLNSVVSVGSSRRFAFRPIPEETSWMEWDSSTATVGLEDAANVPAVIRLFPGDVVSMWGSCNDAFHHAVYPDSDATTSEQRSESRRVSLVFKRALVNGSKGRRGHGLAGEGRRSRRQKVQ